MPWTPSDARRFTKKAKGPGSKDYSSQWSAVANSKLAEGEDEGTAVKIANGVVKNKRAKASGVPKVPKVSKE